MKISKLLLLNELRARVPPHVVKKVEEERARAEELRRQLLKEASEKATSLLAELPGKLRKAADEGERRYCMYRSPYYCNAHTRDLLVPLLKKWAHEQGFKVESTAGHDERTGHEWTDFFLFGWHPEHF